MSRTIHGFNIQEITWSRITSPFSPKICYNEDCLAAEVETKGQIVFTFNKPFLHLKGYISFELDE